MGQLTQMLCGEVNLVQEGADGAEEVRPHPLQVAPGVCAHDDPAEWAARTAHLVGMGYAGSRTGEGGWTVHLWLAGSAHDIVVRGVRAAGEGEESSAAPWDPCKHPGHYACKPPAERSAPGALGPHPAPTVSSREGRDAVLCPAAVLKLAERAREAGWEVRLQYAKGRGVHGSTGRPLAEKESFALVFHSHPMTALGAYAVYRGGSWDSCSAGGKLVKGVTPLVAWLEQAGEGA